MGCILTSAEHSRYCSLKRLTGCERCTYNSETLKEITQYHLKCSGCGIEITTDDPDSSCVKCGGKMNIHDRRQSR